ncbi:hypothetical protein DIURU_001668 [Diutina rugosa]|uniref:Ribosomal lysine N-methyltransferase 4 n=1 Tax=Diutina rugosa TaxID=5481 RepID=A0A642UVN7_DIURU|nr:uncharacterized protein DIURU_001668 [Diutina rugosa]KAA8905240.1 hypothetical protein DIURU_001668 [Diutina rugosa]
MRHLIIMDARTERFKDWLRSSTIDVSPNIEIENLSEQHMGRGVVAIKPIASGETLFTIPRPMILNVATSQLVIDKPDILEKLLNLGQWPALIIVLLYELSVVKEKSSWWDYLQVLPFTENEVKLNQLIFWEPEELELLLPSLVNERVDRASSEKMYKDVKHLVKEWNLGFEVDSELFHRVATTIMSYSFDVERPDADDESLESDSMPEIQADGYYKSLVPLADTLNADTEFHNAHLEYNEGTLVMKATKDIEVGEQIFNTYAEHSNSELLRRYGYVQVHGSQYDFGEVPFTKVYDQFKDHVDFEVIKEALSLIADEDDDDEDNQGICHESYDCFATGEVEIELILLVQVLSIAAQIENVDIAMVKRIYHKCYQLVESKRVTKKMAENFSNIIASRLSDYENVVENPEIAITRKQMAEIVKIGEKRALVAASNPANSLILQGDPLSSIDDAKLIRNITKKRMNDGTESATKRLK